MLVGEGELAALRVAFHSGGKYKYRLIFMLMYKRSLCLRSKRSTTTTMPQNISTGLALIVEQNGVNISGNSCIR